MIKAHSIDVEKLDGLVFTGTSIEIQAAMTVRESIQPFEGVHQSSLFLSLESAATLSAWLARALAQAQAQGWQAPR